MQTVQRFAWRNLLSLAAVLMLLLGSATSALAQATPDASPSASDGAGPALGDAVVLHDSSGEDTIQIAVTQLVDPDKGLENADRGFHWVGIEAVVDNPTDADVDFNAYSIAIVDAEGFVYNAGYGSRSSEDTESRPDFSVSTIPAGEAASGWLFFQVINDATPAWIVFNDGFGSQQFAVLANLTGEAIEEGAETPFYDSSAEEIGTVSVDEIITDFQSTDSTIAPTRGMTAVGVVLTLTSTGSADLQPNTYSFYLVDDFGYTYYPTYYFRSDESISQYPDFPSDTLAAGSSATGIILYEIPRDAAISYITYSPDYTQLYMLAQPGPGSTVSGDTLTPVAAPTSDTGDDTDIDEETPDDSADTGGGEETGDCVGVTEWSAATSANASFINDLFADVESIGDIDPDELHDAADQIRDAIDVQENLDRPEIAQDLNDAVIAMMNLYADVFDDAADRLEDGDDPADIEADLENNQDFSSVITDLFSASAALGEACPDSDLSDFLG